MEAVLESRLALDGLVCLFEDFDFLDNKIVWRLPKDIFISITNQQQFKGVKLLQGKKL